MRQQPFRLQTQALKRCTLNVGSDKTGGKRAWSLVADVGGTNARFAVVDLVTGQLQETTYFSVAEHQVFADVIDLFLAQIAGIVGGGVRICHCAELVWCGSECARFVAALARDLFCCGSANSDASGSNYVLGCVVPRERRADGSLWIRTA